MRLTLARWQAWLTLPVLSHVSNSSFRCWAVVGLKYMFLGLMSLILPFLGFVNVHLD